METGNNLRGLVLSRFKSISSFAIVIGWKRTKASRIINGTQKPDIQDIQDLTKCLDIDTISLFMSIFFAPLSTMWTAAQQTDNLHNKMKIEM